MLDMDKFDAIQISIASPEKIRSWSYGEVKKPETINYRTHKPERDGLFCERIFGPQKDWECFCGKYKSIRYRGIICERCNVEITKASVRRERMGHIQLVTPVVHIWYSKGSPNYIALLLDISARDLEKVLYFQSYIVIDPGNLPLSKKQLLPEEGTGGEMGYRELREKYGDMFVAKMGAEAIKDLLAEIDLKKLEAELAAQLRTATGTRRAHLLKRMELVKWFVSSISRPEWMVLDVIPVIPPDLRPMVQLDGGRFATSDLNDLYRRVINRNNRLKRLIKLQAPDIIIKNEKRMLQEAVNALIDNGRRGKLVTGPNNRPLKSLTDMLKGKQGRFRQNLLGKRVDYSGRSVIVVGPTLKLHQAGLPKKMALELFKPFVMHRLVAKGIAHNIKSAKKMIEREKFEVWDVLEEVIRHHPILLNRAPTLHRLGIQAFEPILIEGKAIQIHPLVCTAYNADFDGDQMAVHVPLLLDAQVEARMLMLSSNNILKPADGRPICHPTQDMTIGLFYLTIEKQEGEDYPVLDLKLDKGATWEKLLLDPGRPFDFKLADEVTDPQGHVVLDRGVVFDSPEVVDKLKKAKVTEIAVYKPPVFMNVAEAVNAANTGQFHLQFPIYIHRSAFPAAKVASVLPPEDPTNRRTQYLRTTIGRLIFNDALPPEFPYQNLQVRKETVSSLIKKLFTQYPLDVVGVTLDKTKELGFRYATLSGLTISMVDMVDPPKKKEILERADKNALKVKERWERGEINREERKQAEINIWTKATEDVSDDLLEVFESDARKGEFNPVYMMAFSGARGNMQQIRQLAAMRGLMSNPKGDILSFPIKSNFREGLNQAEYFISTYGARKGLVDTALRTADSGYLTRRLVDVAQDVVITVADCKTVHGIDIYPIRQSRTSNNILVDDIVVPLRYRLAGRVLAKDVVHPLTGENVSISVDGQTIKLVAGLYCTDEIAAEVENIAEIMVPADQLKPGMIIGEQLIDPKTNRVILRPDRALNEHVIDRILEAQIPEIKVRMVITIRSPLTCRAKSGICRACYGADLSTGFPVDIGEAVGIIAAQSIGEPGTQLTMRTFHLGGVALAQRSFVKARTAGVVRFDNLRLAKIHDRTKFEIGSGTETFDKSEFGANLREVVVGGHVVIEGKGGRKDRVHIPVGADMKVKDGEKVSPGKPLAEYNPNYVVSGYTGEVIFDRIEQKDGMVVSEVGIIQIATQEFDQVKKEFIIEEYKIPQGATLKVEDGDIIHAGNVLAEISAEQHAAIARIDGIAKFENIRVKNRQVISDNGMIFLFPADVDPVKDRKEYPLPRGVKEARDLTVKTGGMILNVKNGDPVNPGERLLSVVSEMDGVLTISGNGTVLTVSRDLVEEFEFKGELEARIDQKNKELSLIAPMAGVVRTISEKSAANKTLDRKRVIIKNEIEYPVPRGVILRPKENCKVPNGQEVAEGGDLTTKLVVQAEVDGVVEIVHAKSERRVHLISEDISHLKGATLARALINKDTEEELAKPGIKIDDDLLAIIDEHRAEIREVYVVAGDTEAVNIRSAEGHVHQYPVPPGGQIVVEDGQLVKAGDKLITDIDPIKSEIAGKVNYIYGYNKVICEEIIEKILVYSGVEFSYPASLNLKFAKTVVKGGELTAAPIPFEEIEQLDPEEPNGGSGIRLRQRVMREKKYKITREMASALSVLVKDGQTIKEGQVLAAMTATNRGVVLLERQVSKEGKAKSTINRIIIQPGEAYQILDGAELRIEDGQEVKKGEILAKWGLVGRKTTDIIQGLPRVAELFEVRRPKKEAVISEESGMVKITGTSISVIDVNTNVEKPIRIQYAAPGLVVHDGEFIEAGDPITDGKVFPKKLVKVVGLPNARRYLIDEIQRVYRDQGVSINDKHLEIIVRQMLRKVTITDPGDSEFLPNETVHVKYFEDKVHRLLAMKKRPPTGTPMIQGITKASLTTDSFISAASFQETTRVLTKAAIKSKIDYLRGLKENLIIGKLIPAGTGLSVKRKVVFKNLPAEVEKPEAVNEELFMSDTDDAELNKLEDSLFLKGGEEPEEGR
ncbi:MAG: DNA-directed RNA polymerase beta' subunit [Candidatus Ozemobacter sibiricus]|uniref:DNA-directed RNA polymerase subunit beta' n=1 Tax=Candidatus Ozemobacter sibiricus TaxID=2268124 RepID=A0A367ZK12_9BACT|nr:MAG: DNA-directed RNA polymerase beta' subunit [Candidatus Ozemobacter sibiricus]